MKKNYQAQLDKNNNLFVFAKYPDEQRGKNQDNIETDITINEQVISIDLQNSIQDISQSCIQDISIIEGLPKNLQQDNVTLNNFHSTTFLDDSFNLLKNQKTIDKQNLIYSQENEENLENYVNFIKDDILNNTIQERLNSFQTNISQNQPLTKKDILQLNAIEKNLNNQSYSENIIQKNQKVVQNLQQQQNNINNQIQTINSSKLNSQNNNNQSLNQNLNSNYISNNQPEQSNSLNQIDHQKNLNNQNCPENIIGENQQIVQNLQQQTKNFNDLSLTMNRKMNSQNNNNHLQNQSQNTNQISNKQLEQPNSLNQIIPQSNDDLSTYQQQSALALQIKEQFEKINNINIVPSLIKSNILQIIQVQRCNTELQKNRILKSIVNNFPSMYDLKQAQQNSEKSKDYYEAVQEFKDSFNMMQHSFTLFKDLRSRIINHKNKFLRNQSFQNDCISLKMNLSYQFSEDDLGDVFKINRTIVQELDTLENELETLKSNLIKDDFITKHYKLQEFYSQVYGRILGYDMQLLQNSQTELNQLKQERDNYENYFNNEFNKYTNKLSENLFNLEFSILKKKNLDERIKEAHVNKNKNLEEMNVSSSEILERKKIQIQSIRKQKDEILKRIDKYKEESQDEQKLKQLQLTEKIQIINNQFRIGSTIEQITSFFYIILIDQSSSFSEKKAHDFAINGVIEFLEKINSNDSVAVLKFNSNIQMKQEKIKKQFLNLELLKQNISNCEGGGTNFTLAINKLQQILTKNLEKDEYPITLLITDGQDPTDLRQTITQTKTICHDMLFFTVGYGDFVNQKQLCAITDQFNDCLDQTKKIYNKEVKLYLQNSTPVALKRDIISIRTQNQITIEDIKEARKFHEDSFQSYLNQKKEFDSSFQKQLENQFQQLSQKEQSLMNIKSSNKYKQIYEQINKQYHQEIEQLEKEKCQQIQNEQSYKNAIQYLKRDFSNKLTKNQDNSSYQEILKDNDIELLFYNVLEQNKLKYKQQIDIVQKKIDKIKSKEQNFTDDKFDEIKNLGFISEKHFQQFNEVCENLLLLHDDLIKQIYLHIQLVQQISSIASKLQLTINFTQKLVVTISEKDSQKRVFDFFKKFDNSIDPMDNTGSKRKILEIMDSSILEWCKESNLEKLYQKALMKINFGELIEYVDKKQDTQKQFIQQKMIPSLIASSKYKSLDVQIKNYQQQIDEQKKTLQTLKDEIEDIDNENDKTQIQKNIEDCNRQKVKLNDKMLKVTEQLKDEQLAYQEQKSEEIEIIEQMCEVFIQAIQFSSRKIKYEIVTQPVYNYLNISELASYYLINYTE